MNRQLSFGFKVTMGQEPFRLTFVLESLIIIRWLSDFPVWLGIRDMIHNRLSFLFVFAWSYYQSALPSCPEANAQGKSPDSVLHRALLAVWFSVFSGWCFSLFFAVGPRYVAVALGSQWQGGGLSVARLSERAALAAGVAFGLPSTGARKTRHHDGGDAHRARSAAPALIVCVPRLQFVGITWRSTWRSSSKCVIGWWLNHRHIVAHPFAGSPAAGDGVDAASLGVCRISLFFRGLMMLIAPSSWLPMMALFLSPERIVCGRLLCMGLFGGLISKRCANLRKLRRCRRLYVPSAKFCLSAPHTWDLGCHHGQRRNYRSPKPRLEAASLRQIVRKVHAKH